MFTVRSLDARFFPATVIEASIGQTNGTLEKQTKETKGNMQGSARFLSPLAFLATSRFHLKE